TSLPALAAVRTKTPVEATPAPSFPETSPSAPPVSSAIAKSMQTADGLIVHATTPGGPNLPASSGPSVLEPVPSSSDAKPKNKIVGVAAPARKKSSGDSSLVRVFGLKLGRVV